MKPDSLLTRSGRRYLLRHPWLFGLSVLGVALGVAVVVAIDLANVSAQRAFELSAETVTGRATHQVVGMGEGVSEEVYRDIRLEGRYRQAAPVVEGYATLPEAGRTFQLLGVDPLAEEPFRDYTGQDAGIELDLFMARPGTAVLSRQTAGDLGLEAGDTLAVSVGGREHELVLVGLLEPEDAHSARALTELLLVDISTAQELLEMPGRLSRIDLLLEDEADRVRIEGVLPEGAEIVRSEARGEAIVQMTRAFEINLQALSLLALLVGMFLIYNTMTFSVVQRRPLIGRLRALGVTRSEVLRLILGEALVIAILGTVVGITAGIVLAQGLLQIVTQTITDLYYVVSVREVSLDAWALAKGGLLGLGATLGAAIFPAREAAGAPASMVLQSSRQETGMRRMLPRLSAAGIFLAIVGAGVLLLPSESIALGYAGLLLIILGFALVTPVLVMLGAAVLRPVMGRMFGLLGRMAAGGIAATLSRTSVAVAALVVAVAATIGVGVMIDSFRDTVNVWLGYSLQADVYVQTPSPVFRQAGPPIDPELVEAFSAAEGVASTHAVRSVEVRTEQGRAQLTAVDESPRSQEAYRFREGEPETIWEELHREDVVLVSEPYAYRRDVGIGDTLRIYTDAGVEPFPVVGIYYDYASDQGTVLMGRSTYVRHFNDEAVSGLALFAEPSQDIEALVERLRASAAGGQDVFIRSNRGLREVSMEVFDRTFTVTVVLRLLVILVAFVGVLSALMALQMEREREFGVLRASGMTPGQLWRYVTLQTGSTGVIAGVLALPLGLVMAAVLIYVINRRSFGWTLQFDVGLDVLGIAIGLAVGAALLAGLYPAWQMANTRPAEALRDG